MCYRRYPLPSWRIEGKLVASIVPYPPPGSPVTRRCWRGYSRLIRAASGVKRKVIRPPCQIGDLNAFNRAEVVIRYRLLPAAASCRGPASPEVVQERRRWGGLVGTLYDTVEAKYAVAPRIATNFEAGRTRASN